jgi:RNA polymerase sigma-70 factor (ECF subfamily)
MSEAEIDSLVELARAGDAHAFGSLYDMFAPRVYRFFRYRVSSGDAAEDLTQRVFLKMIEQLPSYRHQGVPFAAWLFRMARNLWIDDHRTNHPSTPLDDLVESASEATGPEDLAADSFDWGRVRRELDNLSADQREVISCRFFAELTPRETATQMSRSEGSVRVLQHRALATLRSRLGGNLARPLGGRTTSGPTNEASR